MAVSVLIVLVLPRAFDFIDDSLIPELYFLLEDIILNLLPYSPSASVLTNPAMGILSDSNCGFLFYVYTSWAPAIISVPKLPNFMSQD